MYVRQPFYITDDFAHGIKYHNMILLLRGYRPAFHVSANYEKSS